MKEGEPPEVDPFVLNEPVDIHEHHVDDLYPGDAIHAQFCYSHEGLITKLYGRGRTATAKCKVCDYTQTVRRKRFA